METVIRPKLKWLRIEAKLRTIILRVVEEESFSTKYSRSLVSVRIFREKGVPYQFHKVNKVL